MAKPTRRAKIIEGMRWAKLRGRLPGRRPKVSDAKIIAVMRKSHLTTEQQASMVGLSRGRFILRRRQIEQTQQQAQQQANQEEERHAV